MLDWVFDAGYTNRFDCTGDHALIWAIMLSDFALFAAYFAIATVVWRYIKPRHIDQLQLWFSLFVFFVYACGFTHLTGGMLSFWPVYRAHMLVNILAAVVSLAAAILIIPLIPVVMRYQSVGKIEALNRKLYAEVYQLRAAVAVMPHGAEGIMENAIDNLAKLRALTVTLPPVPENRLDAH